MGSARRDFIKKAGVASLFLSSFSALSSFKPAGKDKPVLKPKALQPGDTVGIISPAGAIYESEPYAIAVESFEAMGLKVKLGAYVKGRYGHLAGTDEERAQELNDMFADKEVKAVVAMRGGSGCARILEKIDYDMIAANPKIFIGYSDITALHMAIFSKTSLVTFHGPIAASPWNKFTYDYFRRILFDKEAILLENPRDCGDNLTIVKNRIQTIASGEASGQLVGGNLTVLTGIMGSQYLPDWEGKILFVEEVSEAIYRVDRMMSQLQLAGVLDKIAGFVFGKCTDCSPGSSYGTLTLEEVLEHYLKPLNIPCFFGSMIGHIPEQFTVPIGIEATINADKGSIQLVEPAVV